MYTLRHNVGLSNSSLSAGDTLLSDSGFLEFFRIEGIFFELTVDLGTVTSR